MEFPPSHFWDFDGDVNRGICLNNKRIRVCLLRIYVSTISTYKLRTRGNQNPTLRTRGNRKSHYDDIQ